MKIKEMLVETRPREKAIRHGLNALSDEELLCLLIGSGNKNQSVQDIAANIYQQSHQLADLVSMSPAQLMAIPGIREVKALLLLASIELTKRALRADIYSKSIRSVEDVRDWLCITYGKEEQEHVIALYLDSQGKLLSHQVLFVGTIHGSAAHPREVFSKALKVHASAVLLAHNHPSGNLRPSEADIQFTERCLQLGHTLGVPLVDHVIVSAKSVFSLAREVSHLWQDNQLT